MSGAGDMLDGEFPGSSFYLARALEQIRAGSSRRGLENAVRGLLLSDDLDLVKRSLPALRHMGSIVGSDAWVHHAFLALTCRVKGDRACERLALKGAISKRPQQLVLWRALARLEATDNQDRRGRSAA
ncbi:MAG TPA: hypothetical protein VFF73_31780 [Planctomycetota bacterium]|nr:hypothetical protein [Planctomycetota bacterium]